MSLFGKPKYTKINASKRRGMPDGLWIKCEGCGELIFKKTLDENLRVCPKCDYHFILTAKERLETFLDKNTFEEYDKGMKPHDILKFKGVKSYKEKIEQDTLKTGMEEAVIVGTGRINNREISIGVTDSRFIMGSMGYVVGEKITRMIEHSIKERLPFIMISGSGGGARMYEGIISLMQMAKTSAALARLNDAGLLYISILTNPTMAGVLASFASLGDVVIAEPGALIGFTGPRVIEQTIHQKLPKGFQKSEFLLEHGLIDKVVNRKDMKNTVTDLVDYMSS